MAFTGTPVISQIADSIVRITGVSLIAGAAGTLGLFDSAGSPGVRLPDAFNPQNYAYGGAGVDLQESLDVTINFASTDVATAVPVAIVKTGTVPTDWLCTITNTHGTLQTPSLEIYVKFHE